MEASLIYGKRLHNLVIIILVMINLGLAIFFYYDYVRDKKVMLKKRMDYYNSVVKHEQEWLASLQQSNGSIAFRGKKNGTVSIVPYFSSITAIALLQQSPELNYVDEVEDYFDWYFTHLNIAETDKNGIAGTIYDYNAQVLNGVVVSESTEREYDSIDSYAALFLTALWTYYDKTGNDEFLIEHYQQIFDVVGAMNSTFDDDGLSYINPNKQVKYLMDNAEVYQGLISSINLLEQVFLPYQNKITSGNNDIEQIIAHLHELKNSQEKSLNIMLWNEVEQRYEIGISDIGTIFDYSGWNNFYPDAVVQLFPILFGMLDPDSDRSRNLYHTFGEYYQWEKMEHYEKKNTDFYWGLIAYCGALMRDERKVNVYLDYYLNKVADNHNYPAYNADVAWVVLASAEMAHVQQEQMQSLDPLGIIKVQ